MMSFRTRIFTSALLFAGLYSYTEFDKGTNYTQVDAYLERIEDTCYLEKVEWISLKRQKTMTEHAPCAVVEPLAATHPGYIDYDVVKTTLYMVSYKDARGQWQIGKLTRLKHKDGRALKVGEKTPILMHKSDNKKIRKI